MVTKLFFFLGALLAVANAGYLHGGFAGLSSPAAIGIGAAPASLGYAAGFAPGYGYAAAPPAIGLPAPSAIGYPAAPASIGLAASANTAFGFGAAPAIGYAPPPGPAPSAISYAPSAIAAAPAPVGYAAHPAGPPISFGATPAAVGYAAAPAAAIGVSPFGYASGSSYGSYGLPYGHTHGHGSYGGLAYGQAQY